MKIWLDDIRDAPDDSWIVFRHPETCVRSIARFWHKLEAISLDNDLGEGIKEGGWVLDQIEILAETWKESAPRKFDIFVHSANPVARNRMTLTIRRMNERGI